MLTFKDNNGVKYSVVFAHDSKDTRTTTCTIYVGDAGKENPVATEAVAYCHTNDNFCRRSGRKISFKRAMSNLYHRDANQHITNNFMNEDFRAYVWGEYFKYFSSDPWSGRGKNAEQKEVVEATKETELSCQAVS